jgi:hypothetical protein
MKRIAVVFGQDFIGKKTINQSIEKFEEKVNAKLEELEKNKYSIIKIEFTQIPAGRTAYIYYNTEKIKFPDFTDDIINFPNPFISSREDKSESPFFKPNKPAINPMKIKN